MDDTILVVFLTNQHPEAACHLEREELHSVQTSCSKAFYSKMTSFIAWNYLMHLLGLSMIDKFKK